MWYNVKIRNCNFITDLADISRIGNRSQENYNKYLELFLQDKRLEDRVDEMNTVQDGHVNDSRCIYDMYANIYNIHFISKNSYWNE